jgi:hypothetical protein
VTDPSITDWADALSAEEILDLLDTSEPEAASRWGAESLRHRSNGVGPHIEFLADAELAALPPLEWDIDGVLPSGGLSFLIGHKGVGKSLLALWFACCVGLGRDWYGRRVQQGSVIYVAAEGARSLRTRLELWKGAHGCEGLDSGVRWFPRRLPLTDSKAVGAFIARAAVEEPRLVIIDTLARCTQGIRENDSDGVGLALESADRIRETLGTGVLLLAHPSREGADNPRGHSSQDGAADAIWALKDEDGTRTLTCAKLKDGDESLTFGLALVQCLGSALLVEPRLATVQSRLTPGQRAVLMAIRGTDVGLGVPVSTIIDASKVAKSSVHYILKHLIDRKFVSVKSHRYSLTPAGSVQLSSGESSSESNRV